MCAFLKNVDACENNGYNFFHQERNMNIGSHIIPPSWPPLTHWGRDKMAAISQTTLSNAFSWMKKLEFRLKFQWSLFIRVQLIIFQHWFRWWLGAFQATIHYLNQWWLDYRRIYGSLGLNELFEHLHDQTFVDLECLWKQGPKWWPCANTFRWFNAIET